VQVQAAIVACLVTGSHFPPLRLDVIKHLNTPEFSRLHGCRDPDCLGSDGCPGNRLEVLQGSPCGHDYWDPGYATESFRLHIVHGKNDRRLSAEKYQYSVALPRNELTTLLLIHINAGRDILTLTSPDDEPETRLFVSDAGMAFTDATFTQYWAKLMRWGTLTHALPYFAPSKARTIFVEAYMSSTATDPEVWEGAAAIMGNSPRQWRDSYTPNRKRRLVALAVQRHGQAFADETGGGDGHGDDEADALDTE
jgi:hypothetical protein